VWAVRDRLTGETLALKALAEGASEREVQALVREAVTLSGLEGLGVPKVLRFGRLPEGQRPYLVRELVEGRSLLSLLEDGSLHATSALNVLEQVTDQLTGLHRAGLLHGDIKPANIIVSSDGTSTLVDLGLAAPWREGGTRPEGLTPRYAAPELFAGRSLTVRAEIFAVGATLADVLEAVRGDLLEGVYSDLEAIATRAMHSDPSQRHPSADEVGSAIRHAAQLPSTPRSRDADLAWPVVGVDAAANRLLSQIATLVRGSVIVVTGKPGSGRSVLLRRLAWSLGVEGREVAWVQEDETAPWMEALEMELSACDRLDGVVVLIDGAERLPPAAKERLAEARGAGAKLVLVTSSRIAASLGGPVERFVMPSLADDAAQGLVQRAVPSLPDALVTHVVQRAEGRPGKLRAIVRRIGTRPVVSAAEIDRMMTDATTTEETATEAGSGISEVERLLDEGKFEQAAERLEAVRDADPQSLALCRARLAFGQGEAREALESLQAVDQAQIDVPGLNRQRWYLQAARIYLRLGEYGEAMQHAITAVDAEAEADRKSVV